MTGKRRDVVTVAAAAVAASVLVCRSQCWKRQDSRHCSHSCRGRDKHDPALPHATLPCSRSLCFIAFHFAVAPGRGASLSGACENCILRCATCHLPGQLHGSRAPGLPARAAALFAFTLAVKIIIIKTKSRAQMGHSWRDADADKDRAWAGESALEEQRQQAAGSSSRRRRSRSWSRSRSRSCLAATMNVNICQNGARIWGNTGSLDMA